MAEIRYTRNLFLRCMNVVYLFAFASFYIQIPGLYGNNGVLPARTQLDAAKDGTLSANIHKKPTLLWLAPYVGLDTEYMMDVLSLLGVFLAFTGFVSQKFCCKPVFSALWSLYFSLYQVGQTFMWFQWDVLLLEAGVLCVLIAPLRHKAPPRKAARAGVAVSAPADHVTFWLVRWLLFRLMFSSGVVKLTSGCPAWWGLTALNVHFESMCIPSPLAWYAHHLPAWFLKLNTVFANVAELGLPVLFFFPLQAVRTVGFYIQLFLQLNIILTGNYNFFNFLSVVLCLSLLNDSFFYKKFLYVEDIIPSIWALSLLKNRKSPKAFSLITDISREKSSRSSVLLSWLITAIVYGVIIYATIVLYGIKMGSGGVIDSKIMFTKSEFDNALARALPSMVVFGALSLLFIALRALVNAANQVTDKAARALSILTTLLYIAAAAFIFTDSLVPLSSLHASGNATVPPVIRKWHNKLSQPLHLTNAYGLFRRMTGVGGRPEVIIEGANTMEGPWLEYNFRYKPGNVNVSLTYVLPHQPRLDWQMWFASLGTYHQNPWIMSLAYRLLTAQPEVLHLLDTKHNPFPHAPPKYLRALLYHYHYTPWSQRSSNTWWTREKVGDYFPVFSRDHPPLIEYLTNLKILSKDKPKQVVNTFVKSALDSLRRVFGLVEGGLLMWSLFFAGCTIMMLQGTVYMTPVTSTPKSATKKWNK